MDPGLLYNLFLASFLVGGTLMVCQCLMSLLGLGGHHDLGGDGHDVAGPDLHDAAGHVGAGHAETAGADSHANAFVGILSFRTIVAAFTFFGLSGLAVLQTQLNTWWVLTVALAGGAAALFLVAWVMRSLSQLQAEGTARLERALGQSGTVYLPVPGHRAGVGKVLLNVQNRTVECQAVTAQQDLPTGTKIVVTAVISRDTVEVSPAP
jgi:membrane protein implicated in regulation of membrane protease activity